MLFVYCEILILVSFLVNCGISVPEQDIRDLDEYAKEVSRFIIANIPMSNNTSHESLYEQTDLESFDTNTSVSYEEISRYSDNIRPSPERVMPENVAQLSGSHELPEASRDVPPFSIDKVINSSSTGNQSQQCLFDRQHITLMFKECIYIQATLTTPAQTVNMSEPSLQDYDARFLKYCRRAPLLRSCVKNLILSKMEHCLDEGVRESINNVEDITEHIIKFICIKESDRISIFIADGGLECLLSSNWQMHMCLSLYLGSYVVLSLFELPSLNLDSMKCVSLQSAQRCVAQELESCEDQSSAVVAMLVFHIAMDVAGCSDLPGTSGTTTATETPEFARLLSTSDGKHTTEGIIHLNPQLASGIEHVETTEHYTSSVTSGEDRTYQQSTPDTILSAVLAASGNSQSSISSTELETTLKPPNSLVNGTTTSNDNSAATTIGLVCGLWIFSIIILLSCKCILKTNSQALYTTKVQI